MRKSFFILIFLLFLFSFIAAVYAHSLYLFNISLDFDKGLKSNVIIAAQKFANTSKEPVSFDLDKGLIMAHFEPDQRNYAEINPLNYEVYGMRNENLKHQIVPQSAASKMPKQEGYETAKRFFEKFPANVKSELKYGADVSEVDGTYFYKWNRYVDGIIVADESFFVNVDAYNGNIIAWRLSIFDYPKESIKTVPAISANVAKKVAELSFNAPSVQNFEPYLIIYTKEPVWVSKIQGQLYPYYIGVNGIDGSIAFTGTLPGEIPDGYKTENVKVVETELIKQIYSS
jgi:hypothetical protein